MFRFKANRFQHIPLRRKLWLTFLVLQGLFVVVVASSVFLLRGQYALSREIDRATGSMGNINTIQSKLMGDFNTMIEVGMLGQLEALPKVREQNNALVKELDTLLKSDQIPKETKENLDALKNTLLRLPPLVEDFATDIRKGEEYDKVHKKAKKINEQLNLVPIFLGGARNSLTKQGQDVSKAVFQRSQILFLAILGSLILGILYTFFVANAALKQFVLPLEEMTETTEKISVEDYSQRLSSRPGMPKEIVELVNSLNKLQDTVSASNKQLQYRALHDSLTGLANRFLFLDRLSQAIFRFKRNDSHRYAVLFLDLDRFKVVNDSFGHQAGDELLIAAGNRMEKLLRDTDTLARLGGDEFTILLESVGDENSVAIVCGRILEALAKPFIINQKEIRTTCSLGVVLGTKEYTDPQHVLRHSDVALYQAKDGGKNRFVFFDQTLHANVSQKNSLEVHLRKAIAQRELKAFYQPIVNLANEEIVGFETLLRWQRDDKFIMPLDFIPLAEETGLIVPIGWWIMQTAALQTKGLHLIDQKQRPFWVSINLSAQQLMQQDFAPRVEKICNEVGIDPQFIKLEVTESGAMADLDLAIKRLNEVKELGVKIYLDDFGTGYSSLAHLLQLPVDGLKIDKSFTSRLMEAKEAESLTISILQLAKTMGIETVAEGIETVEQRDRLRELGCDKGQGYLFSRPVSRLDLSELLGIKKPNGAGAETQLVG